MTRELKNIKNEMNEKSKGFHRMTGAVNVYLFKIQTQVEQVMSVRVIRVLILWKIKENLKNKGYQIDSENSIIS